MKKIAIFASGSGSNAENIAGYFENNKYIKVDLILSNRKNAFVLKRAKKLNVPTYSFTKDNTNKIKDLLLNREIDLIVLAGFLLLISSHLIEAFPTGS